VIIYVSVIVKVLDLSRPASIVLSGKLSSNVLLCSIANISVPKVIYLFI